MWFQYGLDIISQDTRVCLSVIPAEAGIHTVLFINNFIYNSVYELENNI